MEDVRGRLQWKCREVLETIPYLAAARVRSENPKRFSSRNFCFQAPARIIRNIDLPATHACVFAGAVGIRANTRPVLPAVVLLDVLMMVSVFEQRLKVTDTLSRGYWRILTPSVLLGVTCSYAFSSSSLNWTRRGKCELLHGGR